MLVRQEMIDSTVGLLGGSLVYLPILKNGSTFFKNNLVENFKWTTIRFSQINWSRHHVFAHIQDPIERRHKGIAEYLETTNTTDLLENPRFREFIRHVPALDDHSSSLFEKFGPYCWMIDWIPMDYGHERTIQLTEQVIRFSGVRILRDMWDLKHQHRSSHRKQEIAADLKGLWEEKKSKFTLTSYFSQDIALYQQVKQRFNQFGDSWNQISWLRERYGNP